MFAYRPSNFEKKILFKQISSCLSLIENQYENITVTSDLSTNLLDPISDTKSYFYDLRDTIALTNLVKDKTCFKNENDTLINIILTNRSNCFQKTVIMENGLSDCYKLVITIFISTFIKLPPKPIRYRSYKTFNKQNFCL